MAPLVAQKMKAGVSMLPWGVVKRPVRASPYEEGTVVKEKDTATPQKREPTHGSESS